MLRRRAENFEFGRSRAKKCDRVGADCAPPPRSRFIRARCWRARATQTLLSYIAGVPQVLLDFVTTINDDDGPVAVQRKLYGPALYAVTTFANRLRVFVQALEGAAASAAPSDEDTALLESAAALYREEMSKWLQFFRDVFEKSPFLVTAEEARAAMGGNEGGGAAAGGGRERVEIAQRVRWDAARGGRWALSS